MSLRIRNKHLFKISRDSGELSRHYNNYDDTAAEELDDTMEHCSTGEMTIGASSSQDVPLGDVTVVKAFWVEFDGDFELKHGGGTETLACTKGSGTNAKAWCGGSAETSQVNITNSGTASIKGTYLIWGDPA